METKLTLKLDKDVIKHVKGYAKKRNISLSKMVEKYFRSLTDENENSLDTISPIVKELSGVIESEKYDNLRDDYTGFLTEKYK